MAGKFTTSTNIIRDTDRELKYIPTPNAIRISNQISNDFKQGIRSFNIIGSYGTGKSSFLWAIEQTLKANKSYFGLNILSNPKIEFIKIIGEYQSLKASFIDYLGIVDDKNTSENIFSEIYNRYYDLGAKNPLLFIIIDEFGKFLEYAAQNEPEKELYFIQQLAEFVNNSDNNIVLLTTVHQNFDAYAIHLESSQRQEWTKVKGRFKEITFNEPVEQLLLLASEYIEEKQSTQKKEKTINELVGLLTTSKAFNINEDYIKSIANKLYPLDSISAYVLTLSLQRYGQNERSLFSFLESTDHTGLYQHSILNDSFYSISEVYDFLIHNYYSFLNSRYNPDFSAWKSIRTSLEKVESLFDKNLSDYEKLIKTIGLLSIYAQSGSYINRDFLIKYSQKSLSIENAEKLIEDLEVKKVILYRNYNNRYILFEGTDLDIPTALYEAGNKIDDITDVVTLLNKNYSLSPVLAKRAMFETGTPRLFEYIISSQPISTKPLGDVDGFINLVFNEKDIFNVIQEVSLTNQEAILYCYYLKSKEIKDLLFEIEKTRKVIEENPDDKVAVTELKNIILHQRNLLNHKILNSLFGDNSSVLWVFNGELKELRSPKEFNTFLSEICQTIYNRTPYFNNELVNKHKISTSIHTAKKNYFKALANEWDIPQLGFVIDKFPPEKTIYLSLLENNGIKLCDDNSSNLIEPHNENGFYNLWLASVEFLNSAKISKRKVSEFVEILNNRPFKLKQGFIDFWIPTFLFIKRDEYALFNENIYTPVINEDILERLAKIPEDFEVKSFALEGVKLDIFNSYRKFLNIDLNKNGNAQTFIETIKPFLVFYRGLPEYSKQTRRLSKESIAIREAIANSKDPEQSFFEDFPTALGCSVSKIQKDRAELQLFIVQLQDSIKEVRNSFDELVNRFEIFLQDKYFDKPLTFEEYKSKFQIRYKNLHRHLLLNSQKSFVQRIDSQIEDKKAWLSSLAQSLIGRSLEKFKDEDELMLYDKFAEMILSLDSLNRISKSKFDEDKEIALDIQINSFGEEMTNKVVRLPKSKSKQVEKLEDDIKRLLSKDKSIDLAAITAVLKNLL
ncbi:hypothetical protein [Flavobacterium chilense]|uniref:Uncharacterized protein n=1 Tax=Flavobacterium chilense TaxID=946677 RepID=A0A1M7MHM1_9FLAO|nr:hypothetical protein [Flavobacterium chilense]SHM89900.1 hypothetical protein SAMN05444484_11288 [Flavobacterium chilense]